MLRRAISGLVTLRAAAHSADLVRPALAILAGQRSASPGAGRCGTGRLWPGTSLIAALQTRESGRPRSPVRLRITRWSTAFAVWRQVQERYRDKVEGPW